MGVVVVGCDVVAVVVAVSCYCYFWFVWMIQPVMWSMWVLVALICPSNHGLVAQRLSMGLLRLQKVWCSNPQKGRCFFASYNIKLALVESCLGWTRSPGRVLILMDSIRSLAGFFNNVKGYYLKRVHPDVWLSVTTSSSCLSPQYKITHVAIWFQGIIGECTQHGLG